MQVDRLRALHKLARDIIYAGPYSVIKLDESLFNDDDHNQISMTLKTYARPNGVATQIHNINLEKFKVQL